MFFINIVFSICATVENAVKIKNNVVINSLILGVLTINTAKIIIKNDLFATILQKKYKWISDFAIGLLTL